MRLGIRGGHTPASSGASQILNELTEDRLIYSKMIDMLKADGQTVVDLTAPDTMKYPDELNYGMNLADKSSLDMAASIHLNSGGGRGCEVWVHDYAKQTTLDTATRILNNLTALGFTNRGIKKSPSGRYLGEIVDTQCSFIIVEVCFVDSQTDADILRKVGSSAVAKAIADGLVGHDTMKTSPPVSSTSSVMYRVILDGKQTMALVSQDAAIAEVKKVVDAGGSQKGTVQRNTDGASVFEYVKTQTPTPVPTTPRTPIMGVETITVEQCQQFLHKHNPAAPDIVPFYKKHGEALGIRWGYAVAQMIKETGYLKFGGDVKADQNNYAGIGAVGGGAAGASFLTPEAGVIAQLQHLYAYASTGDLGDYAQIDPRFGLVKRGSCLNWEDLNGRWAVPGNGYGEEVVEIYKKMATEVVSIPVPTESGAMTLLRKILQLLLDFFKGEK